MIKHGEHLTSLHGFDGSNLSAMDWYSVSDNESGCRTRLTGNGSPSLSFEGSGASTGSDGGDGTRGVGAFFFDWGVTASETRRLAAGSRPARGGSLRFSAIAYTTEICLGERCVHRAIILGSRKSGRWKVEGGKSVTR